MGGNQVRYADLVGNPVHRRKPTHAQELAICTFWADRVGTALIVGSMTPRSMAAVCIYVRLYWNLRHEARILDGTTGCGAV